MQGQLYGFSDIAEAFGSEEPTEIDFAYFQAGLMVRWMVEVKGRSALREVLIDLGEGVPVLKALEKRYGKGEELDREFFAYAKRWASVQGGALDWRDAADTAADDAARSDYFAVMARVRKAMGVKDWKAAEQDLRRVVKEAPLVRDEEKGPWMLLARARRELGDAAGEREALEAALRLDHSMPTAWERLMELVELSGDEKDQLRVSEGYLGVDPLNAGLLTKRVSWLEKAGRITEAVDECVRVKRLEPERGARWDSRIGVLLAGVDNGRARRHLLDALAINPRDRKALDTLERMDRDVSASAEKRGDGGKNPVAEPAKERGKAR
jgi:tetratricopeptide (TPR) repeat protein